MGNFEQEITDFYAVKNILLNDEKICLTKALESGDRFWYRMFVRSFFAHIEGLIYKLQIQALNWNEANNLNRLTNAEKAVIKQENYALNKKGKINKHNSFNSIDRNLRFTIRILKKVYNVRYILELDSDNRWNDFKKSIQMRNNITHPKNEKDLILSEADIDTLLNARKWFLENFKKLFMIINKEQLIRIGKSDKEINDFISKNF
jgi:hypothetical protein